MATRTEVESEPALEPIWDRLAKIERLEPNWNSYGARPPHPAAVVAARELISAIYRTLAAVAGSRAVPYTVAPLVNGGMQVEWHGPGGEIEAEISPERALGYLLVRGSGEAEQTSEGDGVSWDDLLGLITSVVAPPSQPQDGSGHCRRG